MQWYNQRGEASENRSKELQIGFGMERLPCGTCAANVVFLRIGMFAYNLFVRFKLLALPQGWRRGQVRTVRWRLYQMAGKVVRHAGAVMLNVQHGRGGLCEEIRTRWAAAAQTSAEAGVRTEEKEAYRECSAHTRSVEPISREKTPYGGLRSSQTIDDTTALGCETRG